MSIGRPVPIPTFYILNECQEPQPVGVYGELLIGGLGVARGYLRRPELTADRFISDPFAGQGERVYKTGDLARYREDGSIEFLGRIDHQVKVRGYRIELADIESTLGRHPEVHQCVVVARDDRTGDKVLVAYVMLKRSGEETDFRAYLKSKLPEYMVPAQVVFLDELPLTPNGKVDRKALPAPDSSLSRRHDFVGPRSILS